MARFLVQRLLQAIPALLGVTAVVFLLVLLSGDPSTVLLPPEATTEQRAQFRQAYGLDQPVPVQYVHYLLQALRGDFGQSFSYREPALQVVLGRVPATLELAVGATLLALLVAVPAGIVAALRRGTGFDHGVMGLVLVGQSIPTFWLGMMLILLIAVQLKWVPVSGRGAPQQLVLPAATLALYLVALLSRVTRSEMLEVLSQDFTRTARAKGLPHHAVVVGHALRNALPPIVTIVGLQFGSLLGGAVMTEMVFAWPGIGTLVLDSIFKKDYPVVVAAVLLVAVAFIAINLVLDLVYGYLDPRIRQA